MPPSITPAQKKLWESKELRDWHTALERYPEAIESKNKKGLVELDTWYREELPKAIAGRSPGYLEQGELVKLMEWKLARGKWRPRLVQFVKDLSADMVVKTTEEALRQMPVIVDPKSPKAGALPELCKLKGIGPATGSAILAAAHPQVAPFMSDEAMAASLPPSTSSDAYSLSRRSTATVLRSGLKAILMVPHDSAGYTSRTKTEVIHDGFH
ncbi:hypothetical protein CYMTET_28917 [Cymbomonas tetramitiformis]|uniref:Uncharacterized protein n=1 Tax=Cymbomonas tetramitiformis TaxID=36881 RepID=A0AAE0FMA6_9CHLO|nr:hypothetical protein CYMTET_28917 [Cymbomonas tetramitiformis]